MACVQARSPRRLAHDRLILRPRPTRSLGRSPSRCSFLLSPSPPASTSRRLFGRPLPQDTADHVSQALAQGWRALGGARRAHPRDASCSPARRPLPLTSHLRTPSSYPPDTLPDKIGYLGRHLVGLLKPWAQTCRAVAIDSTVLRARGGVWHKRHKEAGVVPHLSIDTEAGWAYSGWHGWPTAGSCTRPARWEACGYRWPPYPGRGPRLPHGPALDRRAAR